MLRYAALMNHAGLSPRKRYIDDGGPFLLAAPSSSQQGFALDAAICDNPACPCAEMFIAVHSVQQLDDGSLQT